MQLHYWNNPDIAGLLRMDLPAMRLLAWFKILGRHAPQVIIERLLRYADDVVATTPATLDLPAIRDAQRAGCPLVIDVVPNIADFERLEGLSPRSQPNFTVGYIGTVSPSKLHPRYVPMSAAVNVPGVRFVVCGAGDPDELREEADRLGVASRFEWRGFVENIRPVLETLDVFGYPLCEDTCATSEQMQGLDG